MLSFLVSCQPLPPTRALTPLRLTLPAVNALQPLPSPAAVAAAQAQRNLGLQYRRAGQFSAAIAALKTAVALDASNVSSYVILGWTLHLDGQDPQAAAVLHQALLRAPKDVPALNALGIVYLVQGDLESAIATLTQSATLAPDNEIPYYNLALAYQRLRKPDQAVANAQRATALDPQNPHPWVALAIAYVGQPAAVPKAEAAYQTAIALDGRYRDAGFLTHLAEAGFSVDQIQAAQAILAAL